MTLPAGSGSVARWTGLISESGTQQYGASARSDSYGYDAIGRLASSNNENNISYDANGNVMSLRRISATGEEIIADLTMSYNDNDRGNRLASVTNTDTEDGGTFTYTYDSSGNLTSDGRNRLQIQNNVLNLPMRVEQSSTGTSTGTMGNGGTMTYTYLGDGTRAAARVGADAGVNAGATSYAGKEEQDIAGMNLRLLDFGARYYDSFTCRWNAVDPLAHKYFPMSPYNYCGNDPVNRFDPDGRKPCDPVEDPKIRHNRASNMFGDKIRIKKGQLSCHQGFDYEAPVGTNVLAVKDGTVVDVGPTGGLYGTIICIEHKMDDGTTLYSFYAHLSETDVEVGQEVKEGDTIGKTGKTGNANNLTGKDEHLHFELRTAPRLGLGTAGRKNPNEIVDTKFTSQDPSKEPQKTVGVVKEDKNGNVTIMNID